MSIRTLTAGGVATIEIARPEKRNALTLSMYEAMLAAVQAARSDPAVRSLLITGQPGVFTAGNDLEDFLKRPPVGEDSPVFRLMREFSACDKPIIAAVTGVAVGIGVTILLHCDLVYVSSEARLVMPFVSLGLVPEFGSSWLLPRLMGHVRASEKLLLGDPFTAAEAVELGLANAALPPTEVLPHARAVAERFNALPPGAVRATKRLLSGPLRESVQQAMQTEGKLFIERLSSPEAREALQAFLEKRKPDFSKVSS
jgi:enoyl-CoA hydratase/carnithine racemase